jgi:hypothetical protein
MIQLMPLITQMKVTLIEENRTELERWVKSRSVGDKQRLRARMILMTADGLLAIAIMARLGVSNPTLNQMRTATLKAALMGSRKTPPVADTAVADYNRAANTT